MLITERNQAEESKALDKYKTTILKTVEKTAILGSFTFILAIFGGIITYTPQLVLEEEQVVFVTKNPKEIGNSSAHISKVENLIDNSVSNQVYRLGGEKDQPQDQNSILAAILAILALLVGIA